MGRRGEGGRVERKEVGMRNPQGEGQEGETRGRGKGEGAGRREEGSNARPNSRKWA